MERDRIRAGEVAAQAGVNIETLRYYERRGLLEEPGRTRAGYRQYPPGAVRLIRFIKRAQDLGFSLEEIRELVGLRNQRRPSRSVRRLAVEKLEDIDQKIRRLLAMRAALDKLVTACTCSGQVLEADPGGARR